MPTVASRLVVLVTAAALFVLSACVPPDPLPPGTNPSPGMRCPVTGSISFSNDWHAPRGSSFHEGNDIFAAYGRPNVAAVAGTIDQRWGSRQGNAIWLHGDDGKLYFYAHLASWVGPDNRRVKPGEVIGYTGNTGDASGGAHHTHFEIRLDWDTIVNPYPALTAACR